MGVHQKRVRMAAHLAARRHTGCASGGDMAPRASKLRAAYALRVTQSASLLAAAPGDINMLSEK